MSEHEVPAGMTVQEYCDEWQEWIDRDRKRQAGRLKKARAEYQRVKGLVDEARGFIRQDQRDLNEFRSTHTGTAHVSGGEGQGNGSAAFRATEGNGK